MKRLCLLCISLVWALTTLSGCVQYHRPRPAYDGVVASGGYALPDDTLAPPLPRFFSRRDCELAYGLGACGSGGEVYAMAGIVAPYDAYRWFIPFHYHLMSGALRHGYFAPPSRYVFNAPYRAYIGPAAVQRYRLITPAAIERYHASPAPARRQLIQHAPAPYEASRPIYSERPHPAPAPAAAPPASPAPVIPSRATRCPDKTSTVFDARACR